MTRQRFEIFTYRHGDTMFTTRFRFVARIVTRFVRTLDCLPAGTLRGTALAAGLVAPEGMEATLDNTTWTWWPVGTERALGITLCRFCETPAVVLTDRFKPVCASHYGSPTAADQDEEPEEYGDEDYNSVPCFDCGHDYLRDAQGRCLYLVGFGDETRVCGWHPDVMGPVACESHYGERVES
jgi:hypothetical protein